MKVATFVAVFALAGPARANPRALPFTYTTETLPAGHAELEQYVDVVPLRAISPATSGPEWYLPSAFQTELEIGLTDRLELGLYVSFVPDPGEQLASKALFPGTGNGMKQRLRYAPAPTGSWPLDVNLYGELTENEREIEVEAKLILMRRFDRLRVAANLSGETELYFSGQRELVLNPSAGVTYEITPRVHLGLDSFVRGEYPMHPKPAKRTFGLGPHAYVGPAVLFELGRVWWSVGVYGRVTSLGHDLQPGEPYGPIYARSIIGYDL